MSTGFAVMGAVGAASADPPPHQDNIKVFVCKYVGKPGASELLQGGGNPLSVSVNSIPNLEDANGDPIPWTTGNVVGHEFADAQGQSLVIAVDNTASGPAGDPTADQCPGSTPQQPTVVTPSLLLNQQECPPRDSIGWRGLVNGVADSATDNVAFALTSGTVAAGQTITVTATASGGVTFPGGVTTMQLTGTFDAAPTNCGGGGNENEFTAPSVAFTEPTCENPNGAQIQLGNQDKVSYGVVGAAGPGEGVTVKATPKAGFEFAAGAQTEFSHTFKTIESLNCPSEQPTIVPSEQPTVGGTQTTRPRPSHKPKPHEERPPVVLGTQAGVPSAVAAGLPGAPTSGSGSSAMLVAQLMVGTGLVLLVAGGWTGMGARRRGAGAHQI